MKLLEYFKEIPKLFDWYFGLSQSKRMNLNYIIIIIAIVAAAYWNDSKHNENYTILSNRIDSVNDLRAKEQERYTVKLESYTDKFNALLEKLIEQKEEVEKLKNDEKK
jgi:hypothetical protein